MSGAGDQAIIDEIVAKLSVVVRRRFGDAASVENIAVATLGASNRSLLVE